MASVCCIRVMFAHACVFNSLEVNPTDNGTTSFSSLGSVGGWVGGWTLSGTFDTSGWVLMS